MRLGEIEHELAARGGFQPQARPVKYHGKHALKQVASTTVTLYRPGKKRMKSGRREIPGRPLKLRLVVSRICNAQGQVLATWMLLTNVSAQDADAATIALWYDWRWRIESFFKLLKSHGQQIEQWQQETGLAVAKRLLVASMACVVVWDLQRQQTDQAAQTRELLVKLSGRQMKYGVAHTAPALLAGLMILLPMLQLLEAHDGDLSALKTMIQRTMPLIDTG